MGQSELGNFAEGNEETRPASDEAQAVAGSRDDSAVDASNALFPSVEEYVEIAVMQVDYTVEGSGDDEYPVIHVFGRTPDQELVHVRVLEFRPYFYAPAENVTEQRLAEYPRITGYEETDEDGEPYESIRGERLVKIFGQTPRDVGQIRDEFDHYEADILFPNRFLIDKDIRSAIRVPDRVLDDDNDRRLLRVRHDEVEPAEVSVSPRVNIFDIEVDDRSGFPEDGEEPIICLTSYDSYDDEYIAWLYEAPDTVNEDVIPESVSEYEPIGDEITTDLRVFKQEAAMLGAFLSYLEETDPDLLSGWNFADFDAPYLLDRLELLADTDHEYDLDTDRLSRVEEVWRSDWQGPDIKGRVVFDLLRAYKANQFTELESYRLDAVGEMELGVGKERYTGDIGDLWERDPERLLEYNLRDVELCVELDEKQDIIAFWQEMKSFVGCKFEDAPTAGDAVDMYVLHKAHGEFVLPSKGTVESGEEFEGGAVFDPITGVRENVSVLDLKCFTEDTEILTPDGPRKITSLDVGEEIYTLNPETLACERTHVTETHEYPNRFGELHHLRGETHDLKVTPNHRFLTADTERQDPERFELSQLRELPETGQFAFPDHDPVAGRQPETFDLLKHVKQGQVTVHHGEQFREQVPAPVTEALEPTRPAGRQREQDTGQARMSQSERTVSLLPVSVVKNHRAIIEENAEKLFLTDQRVESESPIQFDIDDWLAFLGVLTTASLDRENGQITLPWADGSPLSVQSLLDRMGITYRADSDAITVSNRPLVEWVADNCGEEPATRRLPDWVHELDGTLLRSLFETLAETTGSQTQSDPPTVRVESEQLRDDLLDIALRSGYKPTVSAETEGTWSVSGKSGGSFSREDATVEEHDETVYCVTAGENHVVLAGRNGQFQWVGQSLYPMCMATVNASPETKVDPDTYEGETYRTPIGQHFRKEPAGMMREMIDELLTEREEKKTLRDEHEPDTEEYERYDRQQASVKVVMNCFTPDTDVLTPEGVRNIRELEVGESVYSLDPETGTMRVQPVVETHAYPDYERQLLDIQTERVDFRVTPNHRMLVESDGSPRSPDGEADRDTATRAYQFIEAASLDTERTYRLPTDWEGPGGEPLDQFDHPLTHRSYDGDAFLELLAWYLAAGTVEDSRVNIPADIFPSKVVSDGGAVACGPVETLLDGLDLSWEIGDGQYQIQSGSLGELLVSIAGDSRSCRQIPGFVFEVSQEQKRRFFETLLACGGTRQADEKGWEYTTPDETFRDDLLRLAAHLGVTARYEQVDGQYRIHLTETPDTTIRLADDATRSTAEDGVYCVTVGETNTLLAGRNGRFQWVGQSLYGVSGWDRFRLYDKDNAAAVTATGRKVIEFTEQAANELGKEVTYGDSVTADRPVVVRDPSGLLRVSPIGELFEQAQPANGFPPDSPKQRRVLDGWEALSLSADGVPEWQPVQEIVRHQTDKPLVWLQHDRGESTTTRDHSYIVSEETGYTEATPEAVDSPVRIPGIPAVDTVETLDVRALLEAENGTDETVDPVPAQIELESEDGRALLDLLAGYLAAETDSLRADSDSPPGICLAGLSPEWLGQLHSVSERLFGTDVCCLDETTVGPDSGPTLQIRGRTPAQLLGQLAGQPGEPGRIPSFVYHLPVDEQRRFVELLAGIDARSNQRAGREESELPVTVETTSRQLAAGLSVLLIQQDRPHAFETIRNENAETGTESRYRIQVGETARTDTQATLETVHDENAVYDLSVAENETFVDGVGGLVLHNTDSVMLELDEAQQRADSVSVPQKRRDAHPEMSERELQTLQAAIETSREVEEYINDAYDEFAREELHADRHRFQIEFEKLYRRFFQAGTKKRYAGHIVWKEGKDVDDIDITGFEYQRSDIAPITKEVQLNVIEMIVTGENRDEIKSYVHEVIEEFKRGEIDPAQIGIPGGIGKQLDNYDTDTAQVRGAKYANLLLDTNFQRGSKPKRLYLDRVHSDFFERIEEETGLDPATDPLYGEFRRNPDVICFEFADQIPDEFEIDWEKMLDKTLKGPISRVLEALDISWEEVKAGQEQTGLGEFM